MELDTDHAVAEVPQARRRIAIEGLQCPLDVAEAQHARRPQHGPIGPVNGEVLESTALDAL